MSKLSESTGRSRAKKKKFGVSFRDTVIGGIGQTEGSDVAVPIGIRYAAFGNALYLLRKASLSY